VTQAWGIEFGEGAGSKNMLRNIRLNNQNPEQKKGGGKPEAGSEGDHLEVEKRKKGEMKGGEKCGDRAHLPDDKRAVGAKPDKNTAGFKKRTRNRSKEARRGWT